MISAGGRLDFQTVDAFTPPRWPEQSGTIHLDFLVASAARVVEAGATRQTFQPNAEHCLVFTDPGGHPLFLTTLDEIGRPSGRAERASQYGARGESQAAPCWIGGPSGTEHRPSGSARACA
jgi:Glyoxalase-like domain